MRYVAAIAHHSAIVILKEANNEHGVKEKAQLDCLKDRICWQIQKHLVIYSLQEPVISQ